MCTPPKAGNTGPDPPLSASPPSLSPPRPRTLAQETLALHADDHLNITSDIAPPLHLSTNFHYPSDPAALIPAAEIHTRQQIPALSDAAFYPISGPPAASFTSPSEPQVPTTPYIYSRDSAPTTTRLEVILASLLHGDAITYTTGLSALHALYTFLQPARVSIPPGTGYHGSHAVLALHARLACTRILPLDCPPSSLEPGDLIHLETPQNPTGEASNIELYAQKAHARGAFLLVDSTFAPPPLQDPFQWGADVVWHSGTKYLGGHGDLLCGVLAVRRADWAAGLRAQRTVMGSVMGGLEAWLAVRSLRTLTLRVRRQSESAGRLVAWLDGVVSGDGEDQDGKPLEQEKHEGWGRNVVERVQHASLQQRPAPAEWLTRQMPHGFGAVFVIWMRTTDLARRLPSRLRLFKHATSLGGVESLVEWRAMSDEEVDGRLVRISVGVEEWQDLKDDLRAGLRGLAEEARRRGGNDEMISKL